MKTMQHILIAATAVLTLGFISGCSADGEGNTSITVYNDTDRTIRVYYDKSDDEDDNNATLSHEVESIGAGEDAGINAEGDTIDDPEIKVVYGGIVKTFSIDVNLFGYGDVHIKQSSFYE